IVDPAVQSGPPGAGAGGGASDCATGSCGFQPSESVLDAMGTGNTTCVETYDELKQAWSSARARDNILLLTGKTFNAPGLKVNWSGTDSNPIVLVACHSDGTGNRLPGLGGKPRPGWDADSLRADCEYCAVIGGTG